MLWYKIQIFVIMEKLESVINELCDVVDILFQSIEEDYFIFGIRVKVKR